MEDSVEPVSSAYDQVDDWLGLRNRHTVEGATLIPSVASSPWTLRLPKTTSMHVKSRLCIAFERLQSHPGEQTHVAYRWLLGGCSYAFDVPWGWG